MRILLLIILLFLWPAPGPEAAELYRFADEEGDLYYTNIPGEGRVKIPLTSMRTDNPSSPPFRDCVIIGKTVENVMPNLFWHLRESNSYETLKQVQGDKLIITTQSLRKGGLGGFEGHFLNGREIYEPIITSVSQRFTLDPDLVRAVIKAESNFNPRAVSPKGAMGLMQLMPATAKEMVVANPFNPEENINAGVRYLGKLLQLFNSNLPLALAAYNAGPGRVIGRNEIPRIEETRNYVQRVMAYYKNFKRD